MEGANQRRYEAHTNPQRGPPKKLDDELLTIEEVAEILRMPVASMRKRRVEGKPPSGFRVGKRVLYRRSVVEKFLVDQENAEWQ